MDQGHSCEKKSQDTLYKIGMFAAMNRVTIKALRYYDEQGLLKPACVEENGYRYYLLSQCADLHQILALRNMEFSIEDIRQIQAGKPEKELLQKKKQQILKEIAELTAKLAQVESYLLEEQVDSATHVLIKSIPEVIVASMRVTVENYNALFELMPQMGAEMERLGCECAMPEYCFTQYLEPGYKEEQILIETCEAVTELKQDSKLVSFQKLPEIKEAACIFHKGSYDTFPRSYAKVLKFIEENGYEICGNIRESYMDGVWNKDKEEDWLSEIQIPVHKIK
ncbi:MerR family transcriptional regulator [Bacteroides xylanolyticus]|uniref:MerR family transcriptional regulator n=2 Tax=Lacrimispora defluvii TaxID=2719233 RepID=A0ABX1VK18_9FIRM|nr:MerR family transcriptional regulator [Lacrimispora defluvii]